MSSEGNWKELFNACCEGDLELVRHHIENGVNLNYAHPEFLSTPLVAAIVAGKEDVASLLLASGANPGLRSEFEGMTPLQAAQSVGLASIAAQLRRLGAEEPVTRAPSVRPKRWFERIFGRIIR